MATRARIGLMDKTGKILSVYVHYNGYPDYMGKLLTNHYTTTNKIKALLKQGYISMLGEEIEPSQATKRFGFSPTFTTAFNNLPDQEKIALEANHFGGKYSVFYKRDRGEQGVDADVSQNLYDFLQHYGEEYNYIFYNGKWNGYEGYTPIDVITGEEITGTYPIPGSGKPVSNTPGQPNKLPRYTRVDADRDTRKLLAAQKRTSANNFGVKLYVSEEGLTVGFTKEDRKRLTEEIRTIDGKTTAIIFFPTREFYKDFLHHAEPRPQTIKYISQFLYSQANHYIQRLYG